MDITIRGGLVALCFVMLAVTSHADAQQATEQYSESMTDKYSQKTLLKNWALSVCLAQISKDPASREDAGATASAYMEFGHQRIEAYDALRELADRYAKRRYGGSIKSEFNTMKCIDLFHSKELDDLATKFSKAK